METLGFNIKKTMAYMAIIGMGLFFCSCGPMNQQLSQMTGRAELEHRLDSAIAENESLKEIRSRLEAEAVAHKQKIAELQSQNDHLGFEIAALKEKIQKAEQAKEKGISVSLFRGEIIYNVLSEAYSDFKVGLRYKCLNDLAFEENMGKFEQGRGGDKTLLTLLIGIDHSADQIIDLQEAKAFRYESEQDFTRKKLSATHASDEL